MKLIKIERIENKDSYDISVAETNCFFANGILVHNSNAGVSYNATDGMWAQSRENIITPQRDNAGFAFFVESKKETFKNLIQELADYNSIDLTKNTITLFMEWVGKGIQKGVGISLIEKSAFIFGVKVTPHPDPSVDPSDKPPAAYWISSSNLRAIDHKIYNIEDYETYYVKIDFNYPQLSQNEIIEKTIAVETECPVAKAFGYPETIGEGIVFSAEINGKVYRFKSKGEKHASSSKVKTLKPVDDEKINKIIDIVNKVTPLWRMEQMFEKQFDLMNGGQIENKFLGDYIRLVINDILKEELDVLSENAVEPKDINKYVSERARNYFFERANQAAGI